MALKTEVYISDVTNLTEARYYAGMDVTIIGFNSDMNSEFYCSPQNFDAITGWLSGIQTAWKINVDYTAETLQLLESQIPHFVELNFIPNTDQLNDFKVPIIINTCEINDLSELKSLPLHFVTAIICNEKQINEIDHSKIYLHIDTTDWSPSKIDHYIDQVHALYFKGKKEERPGWNDFDQIAALLEYLETE